MHAVHVLFQSFKPALTGLEEDVPPGTRCAMTGDVIARGVRLSRIVAVETSQPHEIFKIRSDYVSPEAAALFKDRRLYGNLLALGDGYGYFPVITTASVDPARNRYRWRDLIDGLYPGFPTVAVFTDNSKRRLWPFAPLGVVGENWAVYTHFSSPPISQVVTISFRRLRECIALCEKLLYVGFRKSEISDSLFRGDYRKLGIKPDELWSYERAIEPWRSTPEFLIAIYITTKEADEQEE